MPKIKEREKRRKNAIIETNKMKKKIPKRSKRTIWKKIRRTILIYKIKNKLKYKMK